MIFSVSVTRRHFKQYILIIGLFENQNEVTDLGISSISIVEERAKEIRDKSDVECNFNQSAQDVPDHI